MVRAEFSVSCFHHSGPGRSHLELSPRLCKGCDLEGKEGPRRQRKPSADGCEGSCFSSQGTLDSAFLEHLFFPICGTSTEMKSRERKTHVPCFPADLSSLHFSRRVGRSPQGPCRATPPAGLLAWDPCSGAVAAPTPRVAGATRPRWLPGLRRRTSASATGVGNRVAASLVPPGLGGAGDTTGSAPALEARRSRALPPCSPQAPGPGRREGSAGTKPRQGQGRAGWHQIWSLGSTSSGERSLQSEPAAGSTYVGALESESGAGALCAVRAGSRSRVCVRQVSGSKPGSRSESES